MNMFRHFNRKATFYVTHITTVIAVAFLISPKTQPPLGGSYQSRFHVEWIGAKRDSQAKLNFPINFG